MPQCRDQGVDDGEVGQSGEDAGTGEGERVDVLHPENQVADRDDHGLHHGQRTEQPQPAPVGLADGEPPHASPVHFGAEDDHQHERADPQRQVREQGRHPGAVAVDRVHRVALHLGRGRQEPGDAHRVEVGDGIQQAAVGGDVQGEDVGLRGPQSALDPREVPVEGVDDAVDPVEPVVDPVEQAGGLLQQGAGGLQRPGEPAGGGVHAVDRRVQSGQCVRHGGLQGSGGVTGLVGRRAEGVGGGTDRGRRVGRVGPQGTETVDQGAVGLATLPEVAEGVLQRLRGARGHRRAAEKVLELADDPLALRQCP